MLPAFLFVLALALRVTWILAVPSKPVGDFAMYLESATYLFERGAFDSQFIYMPGYIFLAGTVQWLGGGWLAIKLTVSTLAATGAPLVYGITLRLWGSPTDRRSAAVAGLLYALWPGGICVASVTGTDMPAAILVAVGAYALVRAEPKSFYPAAAVAGVMLGLAAWIRAVALPLVPLCGFLLWGRIGNAKRALRATALAALVALVVLSPWAVRNRLRYGEWFLSDSHGGLTAMVGAYPNADGQFTRALNRTYETVTGLPWLAEPHRRADADAYAEAKRWAKFEPSFALGLAIARVDKLLSNERSLLYWPLYRAGVLRAPQALFFNKWRPEIEFATDVVWWLLLWGCLAAIPLALLARRWQAMGLLPMQGALVGVYVLYFAESRYHLAIAVLAFPGMAATVVAVLDVARGLVARTADHSAAFHVSRGRLAIALTVTLFLGLLYVPLYRLGQRLIETHRWAVHACNVDGSPQYCLWKRGDESHGSISPVVGVFDGVGLSAIGSSTVLARTSLSLQAHRYALEGTLHLRWSGLRAPGRPSQGSALVRINEVEVARVSLESLFGSSAGLTVRAPFQAQKGDNIVSLQLIPAPLQDLSRARLWLVGLTLQREASTAASEVPL